MNKWLAIALFMLSLFAGSHAHAQVTEDFGVWGTVSFNKDVSKKFDVSIDQEIRLEDNATVLGRAFTNFGVDYKAKKWLRLGGNYRLIFDRRKDGSYGQRHRLSADAILRAKEKRFTFAYRARLQWEVRGYNYSDRYGFSPTWDMRNRFKVNYKVNRQIAPYLSADIRISIDDARTPYLQGVDRIRLMVGVDWVMSATKVLDIYFVTSEEVQVIKPKRIYAIGIGFNFGSSRPLIGS